LTYAVKRQFSATIQPLFLDNLHLSRWRSKTYWKIAVRLSVSKRFSLVLARGQYYGAERTKCWTLSRISFFIFTF